MSICLDLMKGFDLECDGAVYKKYFQQIVLVNRADVDEYFINSDVEFNRIYFNLKEDKTGFLFRTTENGTVINPEFSKSTNKGINYYEHKLQFPIVGINENSKSMLKQLDNADYFAAVHFKDGTIEIHGFNYGLKTENYNYRTEATIDLVSKYKEYDPPYVYVPSLDPNATGYTAQAITDFNNLFAGIPAIYGGDFNNDFNDDFNNQVA